MAMTEKDQTKRRAKDSGEVFRDDKKEGLEEVPTIRPGDKVLRRRRRPRGVLHTVSQNISRFFKRATSK